MEEIGENAGQDTWRVTCNKVPCSTAAGCQAKQGPGLYIANAFSFAASIAEGAKGAVAGREADVVPAALRFGAISPEARQPRVALFSNEDFL